MISYLGSLVQSCYREGGVLQTDTAVCGAHSQSSGHTGFAPAHGCVLSPSTLLRLQAALQAAGGPCIACGSSFRVLHKSADLVAPVFCAFPGLSGSGSQELDWCTLPGCGVPFPLCSPSLNFCSHQLGARGLCLFLGAVADVDHPESQEVFG